jgi:hypothetical protein
MEAENCSPVMFYGNSNIKFRERFFGRPGTALKYKKNKSYRLISPTSGELKSQLKLELKHQTELMQIFTNKLRREHYLQKLGELERARDLGEIEVRKFLATRLVIDSMQLLKDISTTEGIDYESIVSTTALELNEERCIENFTTFTERLFYTDTNIQETLMLIYSTLVSYLNYNEISYDDTVKSCQIAEDEQGSFLKGQYIYRIN